MTEKDLKTFIKNNFTIKNIFLISVWGFTILYLRDVYELRYKLPWQLQLIVIVLTGLISFVLFIKSIILKIKKERKTPRHKQIALWSDTIFWVFTLCFIHNVMTSLNPVYTNIQTGEECKANIVVKEAQLMIAYNYRRYYVEVFPGLLFPRKYYISGNQIAENAILNKDYITDYDTEEKKLIIWYKSKDSRDYECSDWIWPYEGARRDW